MIDQKLGLTNVYMLNWVSCADHACIERIKPCRCIGFRHQTKKRLKVKSQAVNNGKRLEYDPLAEGRGRPETSVYVYDNSTVPRLNGRTDSRPPLSMENNIYEEIGIDNLDTHGRQAKHDVQEDYINVPKPVTNGKGTYILPKSNRDSSVGPYVNQPSVCDSNTYYNTDDDSFTDYDDDDDEAQDQGLPPERYRTAPHNQAPYGPHHVASPMNKTLPHHGSPANNRTIQNQHYRTVPK